MKIQKSKFLIPVLAIIFAFSASAFTTVDDKIVDDELPMITGYTTNAIPGQPCEAVNVNCNVTGDFLCTVNSKQVFRFISGTSCISHLKRD